MLTTYSRVLLLCLLLPCSALALDPPKGRGLVTFSGVISEHNDGQTAVLDDALLDTLPVHTIVTNSPWYSEPQTFDGPLLRDVLALVGAKGQQLKMRALNDYAVTVPITDATQFDAILARRVNGEKLSVRDKGPLFLVYPYDSLSELQSPLYYNRSIWQIKSIDVE